MRKAIGSLMVGLALGLAVLVGKSMSTDPTALVIGVTVGAAAGVLLVAMALSEQRYS
jgi:F0F1-type ATP synthase assembly protein I